MRTFQATRLIVLCGVIFALLPAIPANAAMDAYMTIKGAKQGQIKSDPTSDNIHIISVVRDTPMATALPTGRRMHSTITIVREIDRATPKFDQAFSTSEPLTEVVITFSGATGGAKTAQKIVLTNATILSVRKSGNNETITLDYQAIEVTTVNGGKSATDDWNAPV